MSEAPAPTEATVPPYTPAQLHAEACVACGRDDCKLMPAGYLLLENHPGQLLPWAVAVCPDDRGWEPPC